MASSQRHAHHHRPVPSIPLPLATRFGALPSRLPGKTLTPVLYILINTVPIYLTLSPSYEPHLSLLPLLLSLEPPLAPLNVLAACKLRPGDYSLDLNGEAPFVDLWIPFQSARRICEYLGVSRLFWDPNDPKKGLLGLEVARAVSWDESQALGHNWLPSPSSLPPSSYSLAALMDTPFGSISIIPEDRCITTQIDHGRRARIMSQALSEDSSRIRHETWGSAWEALLRWTVQAWEEYLEHPSQPDSNPSILKEVPAHTLLQLLPALLLPNYPSYMPSLSDLQALSSLSPVHHTHWQVLMKLLWHLNPFYHPPPPSEQDLQRHARINLGLVESVGMTIVGMWHARTIIETSHSADLIPRIVIECSHRDETKTHGIMAPRDSSVDELDHLEVKRRSSPPRVRRKVRRKSRSSPRVVHHVARRIPGAVETMEEWMDDVEDSIRGRSEASLAVQRTLSSLDDAGKTNGSAKALKSDEEKSRPVWTEPDGDSTSIFDDQESDRDDRADPVEPETHELQTELLKTARLPWWIIGTTITIPILAFMFLRSNWGIVTTIWGLTAATYATVVKTFSITAKYLVIVSRQVRNLSRAAWQQRDRAKEGIGTVTAYPHKAWNMGVQILDTIWLYISVAYQRIASGMGMQR